MRTIVVTLAAMLLSVSARAADVAGTWHLDVDTQAGKGTPTLVLVQTGDALTGTYTGRFGEVPITGTAKDDTIEFAFEVSGMMGSAKVIYTGTVSGETMSGSMKMNDRPGGTFTGKREAR